MDSMYGRYIFMALGRGGTDSGNWIATKGIDHTKEELIEEIDKELRN